MNVKVSIPVNVGGYTGQRDQWVESTHDFEVSVDDSDVVTLSRSLPYGGPSRIRLDLNELNEAIGFARKHT